MVRYLAINVFMAIIVFASAGLALQSIKASHETTLWDEIATQVGMNTIQLKSLQGELDQLERQECFVSKSLGVWYDYFDVCSSWEMRGYNKGDVLERCYPTEKSWQVPTHGAGATQYN